MVKAKKKTKTVPKKEFEGFYAEFLTAQKFNARCVTHNVDLNDKFNLIGHVATMPEDGHKINARTQEGKNIEFKMNITMSDIKEIERAESNP